MVVSTFFMKVVWFYVKELLLLLCSYVWVDYFDDEKCEKSFLMHMKNYLE